MAPTEMALDSTANINHAHVYVDHEKFFIRLATAISILAGPAIYTICSAINANFAQGQNALALFAIMFLAFEAIWVVYGLGTLLNKAIHRD